MNSGPPEANELGNILEKTPSMGSRKSNKGQSPPHAERQEEITSSGNNIKRSDSYPENSHNADRLNKDILDSDFDFAFNGPMSEKILGLEEQATGLGLHSDGMNNLPQNGMVKKTKPKKIMNSINFESNLVVDDAPAPALVPLNSENTNQGV
jgi:hypothetical protein